MKPNAPMIEQMLVHLTGGRVSVETVHSKLIRTPRRRELALWEARRNRCYRCFEIYAKLKLRRSLHRKVLRPLTTEYPVNVTRRLPAHFGEVDAIGNQPSVGDKVTIAVDCLACDIGPQTQSPFAISRDSRI